MTDPQPKEWRRFSVSALDFRGRDETIEVIELAALDELRRENAKLSERLKGYEESYALKTDAYNLCHDAAEQFKAERDHAREAYDNAMDQVNSLKAKLSMRDKQLALAKDALGIFDSNHGLSRRSSKDEALDVVIALLEAQQAALAEIESMEET